MQPPTSPSPRPLHHYLCLRHRHHHLHPILIETPSPPPLLYTSGHQVPSLPFKSPVYHETSVASVVSASVVDRSIGTDNPHLSLGLQADLWCIEHLRYYFLGCLAEHPTFVGHSNLLIEVVILIAEHWEHSRRVDIKT
ncbi:hypothetical protein Tco_1087257 [Tanacetum coccineum]